MSAVKNHRPSAPAKAPRGVPPVAQAALGPTLSRSRPSWSGLLRLSLVSVPVKAYPAVSSSNTRFTSSKRCCSMRQPDFKVRNKISIHQRTQ